MQKGIKRLLRIANIIYQWNPKIIMEVIGTGKDDCLLSRFPKNVKILGNVGNRLKRERLAKANAIVVTSNLEPFSIVTLEGLFSGLPVVCTPASGPTEIVSKHYLFGKISTFSPKDLTRDLYHYFLLWESNKEEYFKMRMNISESAKLIFDEKIMFASYESLILNPLEM